LQLRIGYRLVDFPVEGGGHISGWPEPRPDVSKP
jgi:hypothetical protein